MALDAILWLFPTDGHHPMNETGESDSFHTKKATMWRRFSDLDRNLADIVRDRPFLARSQEGVFFTSSQVPSASLVSSLMGFRLSDRWFMLRNPYSHLLHLVPSQVMTVLLEASAKLGKTTGDAYAAASYVLLVHTPSLRGTLADSSLGRRLSEACQEFSVLADELSELVDPEKGEEEEEECGNMGSEEYSDDEPDDDDDDDDDDGQPGVETKSDNHNMEANVSQVAWLGPDEDHDYRRRVERALRNSLPLQALLKRAGLSASDSSLMISPADEVAGTERFEKTQEVRSVQGFLWLVSRMKTDFSDASPLWETQASSK